MKLNAWFMQWECSMMLSAPCACSCQVDCYSNVHHASNSGEMIANRQRLTVLLQQARPAASLFDLHSMGMAPASCRHQDWKDLLYISCACPLVPQVSVIGSHPRRLRKHNCPLGPVHAFLSARGMLAGLLTCVIRTCGKRPRTALW